MENDPLLIEYAQSREELRHRYANYRTLFLILITGITAIFSYGIREENRSFWLLIPIWEIVWISFLASNFYIAHVIKNYLVYLESTISSKYPNFQMRWFSKIVPEYIGALVPKGMVNILASILLLIAILGSYGFSAYFGAVAFAEKYNYSEPDKIMWVFGSIALLLIVIYFLFVLWRAPSISIGNTPGREGKQEEGLQKGDNKNQKTP